MDAHPKNKAKMKKMIKKTNYDISHIHKFFFSFLLIEGFHTIANELKHPLLHTTKPYIKDKLFILFLTLTAEQEPSICSSIHVHLRHGNQLNF